MTYSGPAIFVIGGPHAAAGSGVARLLAARFEREVHVEGDAAAEDRYFNADFTVALEAIVVPSQLGNYRTMIRGRSCDVVVMHEDALPDGPRVGVWLDVSEPTREQAVDAILAATRTHTPGAGCDRRLRRELADAVRGTRPTASARLWLKSGQRSSTLAARRSRG